MSDNFGFVEIIEPDEDLICKGSKVDESTFSMFDYEYDENDFIEEEDGYFIRIVENSDWVVDYDRSRGMYRLAILDEDGMTKRSYWFDAYKEKKTPYPAREVIANSVERKMTEMCGCQNCIEIITNIIKDDVKPFKSHCEYCEIECESKKG